MRAARCRPRARTRHDDSSIRQRSAQPASDGRHGHGRHQRACRRGICGWSRGGLGSRIRIRRRSGDLVARLAVRDSHVAANWDDFGAGTGLTCAPSDVEDPRCRTSPRGSVVGTNGGRPPPAGPWSAGSPRARLAGRCPDRAREIAHPSRGGAAKPRDSPSQPGCRTEPNRGSGMGRAGSTSERPRRRRRRLPAAAVATGSRPA